MNTEDEVLDLLDALDQAIRDDYRAQRITAQERAAGRWALVEADRLLVRHAARRAMVLG